MGLFHDVCNAFVRVSDGRALSGEDLKKAESLVWAVDTEGHRTRLSGEALANALAARGWGICGHKVSKRARVCGWCGKGAPDGWVKCPQCGKWVGNDSQYCPHCNHPLHPSERIDLAGGVWDRDPECYAQRFELDDVRFLKENGLLVQEGTNAILLDGGNEVKVLGAGRHSPTGTLRTINWFGNPPPRSAVMVDSGDVVFRVEFKADAENAPSLRSAEELEVGAEAEITVRFMPNKAEAFMQNFMKDRRKVTAKEVCQLLYQEALSAVRDLCLQSKIEDLVKDPNRRERFEEAISRALKEPLARCGIELVRVGAVEFDGKAYEDMREKYGELEKQRRLVEYEKKQLDLIAEIDANDKADKLALGERTDAYAKAKAKREHETAEYLAQLAQEKDLGEIARTEELQIAVRVAKGNVAAEDARQQLARQAEQHAYAMRELTNKLELDAILTDYDLADRVKQAKNQLEVGEIQNRLRLANAEYDKLVAEQKALEKRQNVDAEIYEAEKWRELKEKIEQAKSTRKMAWANLIRDFPIEKIIAVTEDAMIRENLMDVYREQMKLNALKIKAAMTWEQLLGLAADNPNAAIAQANANALARMAEAGEQSSQKALSLYREAENANNLRIDKFVQQLHAVALESVKHQSTTIVPPTPVTNMQH